MSEKEVMTGNAAPKEGTCIAKGEVDEATDEVINLETGERFPRYFTLPDEEFETEIAPLFRKLYEVCGERNLPVILCIARSNSKNDSSVAYAANLPGRRTPEAMRLADLILDGGDHSGMGSAVAGLLAALSR